MNWQIGEAASPPPPGAFSHRTSFLFSLKFRSSVNGRFLLGPYNDVSLRIHDRPPFRLRLSLWRIVSYTPFFPQNRDRTPFPLCLFRRLSFSISFSCGVAFFSSPPPRLNAFILFFSPCRGSFLFLPRQKEGLLPFMDWMARRLSLPLAAKMLFAISFFGFPLSSLLISYCGECAFERVSLICQGGGLPFFPGHGMLFLDRGAESSSSWGQVFLFFNLSSPFPFGSRDAGFFQLFFRSASKIAHSPFLPPPKQASGSQRGPSSAGVKWDSFFQSCFREMDGFAFFFWS